jgi:predicted aspartyl protease
MKTVCAALMLVTLTLTPGAGRAQGVCPFVVAADLPVTYVHHHSPVVTIMIKGMPVTMEVDTGSDESYLTTRAYDRLNLNDTYQGLNGMYGKGVAGPMQINSVTMQDVTLGHVTLRDELLFISDSVGAASHGVPLADGLMGEDIMKSFDIGLDLPDNRIIFYDPPDCAATEPPWAGSYAAVPLTAHPKVGMSTVDYGVDDAVLAAMIDTGAETSLIARTALQRTGIRPAAVQARAFGIEGVGANKMAARAEEFASITIGAESFADMWVVVADSPISEITDALIGEDYLASHKVFIANSSKTAFFYTMAPVGG